MGDECDLPGMEIFQRTLFVSIQVIGGFEKGATQLVSGHSHWDKDLSRSYGFVSADDAAPVMPISNTADAKPNGANFKCIAVFFRSSLNVRIEVPLRLERSCCSRSNETSPDPCSIDRGLRALPAS